MTKGFNREGEKETISNMDASKPSPWGHPVARFVGQSKGGLLFGELYRVVSNDNDFLTVKNNYGKNQSDSLSNFKYPHQKY